MRISDWISDVCSSDLFAQGQAEGLFDQPALFKIACQLKGQGATGSAHAVVAVEIGAASKNNGNGRQRNHIVDDSGLPEQAFDCRQRRLGTHQRAFAFQAFQQRGFFAADIGPGGAAYFKVEAATAAAYVWPQTTGCACKVDGGLARTNGNREGVGRGK